jgi:hypothetical protein
MRTPHPSHQVHHLRSELERSRFEPDIAARGGAQDEPKVDMDDVTKSVQENVSVVAILDLQEIANDAIARQGADEVLSGDPKGWSVLIAKENFKEMFEVDVLRHLPSQNIEGNGVRDGFDETGGGRERNDPVGSQPAIHFPSEEDRIDLGDELACTLLLSQVIVALDDHGNQSVARNMTDGTAGAYSLFFHAPSLLEHDHRQWSPLLIQPYSRIIVEREGRASFFLGCSDWVR